MVTLTMKQAETVKTLLLKNKKATKWLDAKMEKAKGITVAATTKKTTKKAVKKVAKKTTKKA